MTYIRPLFHITILILMFLISPPTYAKCEVTAVVFNTEICQSDISISNEIVEIRVLSIDKQFERETRELANRIRSISARYLLDKNSYTSSEKEIKNYMTFHEKANSSRIKHTEEVINTIENLFNNHQYTSANKKILENDLDTFRQKLKQLKRIEESTVNAIEYMQNRFGENAVKKYHIQRQINYRRVAEQWVSRWKMNKALYEKYGGRVIFQQAGIEPIDAYRAYLKDIREKGALKILNTKYAGVFDEFERYLDVEHNYLNESGDNFFYLPYWETADIEKNHQEVLDGFKATQHN